MMKRIAALIMLLVLTTCSALALANPWTEVTEEELMQHTGLRFDRPASVQEATLRLLESEGMAEMTFEWCGIRYTARIRPADGFEDISGMHMNWTDVQECEVRGRQAQVLRAADEQKQVDLCLWVDMAPGLMYSLSAVTAGDIEFDIRAAAEMLFIPVQGETDEIDNVTALEIANILERCIGYEGTAGESLKKVIIAGEVCRFLIERNIGDQDIEGLEKEAQIAWMALPEVYRAEAKSGFDGVAWMIDGALCDLEGHMGLFEDAGMAEEMPQLLQDPQFLAGWQAFYWGLQNETDM